ncbi:MAG: gliding motility-associated C-terminal domain-containing protein [Bacteroidota bacterium]
MSKKILLLVFLLSLGSVGLWATHNRAGEISIEQVGDCTSSLTVRATIVTYSKASSFMADRDTLTICWGDGTCSRIDRQNGPIIGSEGPFPQGDIIENDTKRNVYVATHTYPARGTYAVSMTDPNRNGGILNVNFPNSEMIRFHLQTVYTFPNPQFQGCNDTPVLLQPPVDIACVGQPFTHNPNAFDRDGDSLSYEFVIPLDGVGSEVPNYDFPNEIGTPGPMNSLTIDPVTGDILWDAPQREGEYNLAMIIIEWRDGFPLDTILRDMQILVENCQNLPPEVEVPFEEVCVVAGDVLEFQVSATAPLEEMNQRVRLTALGGPFEFENSPAEFLPDEDEFRDDPNVKTFRWQTTCEHISDQFYSVVFRGKDNFVRAGRDLGLATLKTVRIKVVGPPPQDVVAEPVPGAIDVTWELPYDCDMVPDNYFQGFTVWRREGSNPFPIDSCETGLAGRGYEQLTTFSIIQERDGRYFYRDEEIISGRTYCYRIVAEFARTTPGGNFAYNFVESLPSDEGCIRIKRDVPFMTKADVITTSPTDGIVEVCYAPPIPENLDTNINRGPYIFELQRAEGINPAEQDFQSVGFDTTLNSLSNQIADICYTDTGLNTEGAAYSYRVRFFTEGDRSEVFANTDAASTVFLTVNPTNLANRLSWSARVPWNNTTYTVFKQNEQGTFDSLTTTTGTSFSDMALINGEQYCYFIRSTGTYGVENITDPIINRSQIACGTPFDDDPPCPPILDVEDICGQDIDCTDPNNLVNRLFWDNPNLTCEETDTRAYNVYYAPSLGEPLQVIATIEGENATSFEHSPGDFSIAGCYAVASIDTAGNVSEIIDTICVDNCPQYSLPNTFTPNGDGSNDLFTPFPYCFIESIDLIVYNRLGQVVFRTTDPDINWDGRNQGGDDLPDGTYVYTCKVFEQRVDGPFEQEELLRGFITILRN